MRIPINLRRPREPFPSFIVPALLTQILPDSISTHVQRQTHWEGAHSESGDVGVQPSFRQSS